MKRLTTIAILCAFAIQAKAQDLKERMLEVRKQYESLSRIHIKMAIKSFSPEDAGEAAFVEHFEVAKDHESYWYKMSKVELMVNGSIMVMAVKDTKQILVGSRDPREQMELMMDPVGVSIDSILGFYDAPKYIGKVGAVEHYRLTQKIGDVRTVDIFYDTKRQFLDKIKYDKAGGESVSIEFTLFDKNPVFADDLFSEDRYFTRVGDRLYPGPGFGDYQAEYLRQ